MATETNTKKKTEETNDPRLEVRPIPFKALGKTTRINSRDLAILIRETLQTSFHDLIGCFVGFNGDFYVTLFFENNEVPVPEGKIKNLVNLTTGEGIDRNNIFMTQQLINRKYSGRTFDLNDDTKIMLSEFMYGGKKANPIKDKAKWEALVKEQKMPAGNVWQPNSEHIIVQVSGFNIRYLLKAIYGDTMVIETVDEDGDIVNHTSSAFYDLRLGKPMPDGTFMINIEQFDNKAVQKFTSIENPMLPQAQGIVMF